MAERIINLGPTHRIIVDDTANTWKLQFYDSATAAWKDIMSYDTVNQRINSDFQVADDVKILLGSDKDFSLRYDSTADKFILRDEVNAADVLQIDKTGTISAIGNILQDVTINKAEPRFIATDTATGGAERRFASSGGHAKIKDSADADVMDLEAHGSRHDAGAIDQLRLISQLTVLNEGVTWVIDTNKTTQIALPPGGQVQGTDTIQGDGNLLIFEV